MAGEIDGLVTASLFPWELGLGLILNVDLESNTGTFGDLV